MRATNWKALGRSFVSKHDRRGAVLVFFAFALVVILGVLAFALDLGSITVRKTQLQAAADAAVLAGASVADKGSNAIEQTIDEYLDANHIDRQRTDVRIDVGKWDRTFNVFRPVDHDTANAVRVSLHLKPLPSFFGRIFQASEYSTQAESVAVMRGIPRDIVLLLDLTASLQRDGRIHALRRGTAHFLEMIEELQGNDQVAVLGFSTAPVLAGKTRKGARGVPYVYKTEDPDLEPITSAYCTVIEGDLTTEYDVLRQHALSPQNLVPGKYGSGDDAEATGTGGAIRDAIHFLHNHPSARKNVEKLIVLVTDGLPNRPRGWGFHYAIEKAKVAASHGVRIHTVGLGSDEDLPKMLKGIAVLTQGRYFSAMASDEETLITRALYAMERAALGEHRSVLVQ